MILYESNKSNQQGPAFQSIIMSLLVAFVSAAAGFQLPARSFHLAAVPPCRAAAPHMVDPISVAAASFAAGLTPPSLMLMRKEGEIRELKEAKAKADAELTELREGFVGVMRDLELTSELADAQLSDMLQMTAREARRAKKDVGQLKQTYEEQVKKLKELVADYSDRMELQQNSMKRNSLIVDSAVSERAALTERANLLEAKWLKAKEELEALQNEIDASPFERILKLFQS